MRTLVDLPEADLQLLNQLSKAGEVSRAELIRQAVSKFLEPHKAVGLRDAFGLWADMEEDSLAYQERMRSEWER